MAAKKTVSRKPAAKAKNLSRKKPWMNKWLVLGVLALIVVAGIVAVRLTHASNVTFYRSAAEMSGGQYVQKLDGTAWRNVSVGEAYGETSSIYSAAESRGTRNICVNFTSSTGNNTVRISIPGSSYGAVVQSGNYTLCTSNGFRNQSGVVRVSTNRSISVHHFNGTDF